MKHRVFLSHQGADKSLVRHAGVFLAAHNMEPILDEWSFIKGESLQGEIEKHISRSTCFVLFWSSSAASSEYVQFEDEIASAKKLKDSGYKVHVVRLDDTVLPKRHSFDIYHDWRRGKRGSKSFERHLESLRRAIQGIPESDPPMSAEETSFLQDSEAYLEQSCQLREAAWKQYLASDKKNRLSRLRDLAALCDPRVVTELLALPVDESTLDCAALRPFPEYVPCAVAALLKDSLPLSAIIFLSNAAERIPDRIERQHLTSVVNTAIHLSQAWSPDAFLALVDFVREVGAKNVSLRRDCVLVLKRILEAVDYDEHKEACEESITLLTTQ